MDVERGFWRLTCVASAVILVVATITNVFVNDTWYILFWLSVKAGVFPTGLAWFAVGFPFAAAALPWGLFYAVRWIVYGFKRPT